MATAAAVGSMPRLVPVAMARGANAYTLPIVEPVMVASTLVWEAPILLHLHQRWNPRLQLQWDEIPATRELRPVLAPSFVPTADSAPTAVVDLYRNGVSVGRLAFKLSNKNQSLKRHVLICNQNVPFHTHLLFRIYLFSFLYRRRIRTSSRISRIAIATSTPIMICFHNTIWYTVFSSLYALLLTTVYKI